ncbi:hypothetical protein [Microbispora rosea]|uniref:hypothetical protein n=1 Tax=Microbispora rosea TaxID=58117 RepID=UPI0033F84C4A
MTHAQSAPQVHPTRNRVSPGLLAAFVVFAVAMVLRAAFAFWHPDLAALDYENLSPIREQWWAFHFFVGAPGAILAFVAFSILAWSLCRGRASVVAAIGAPIMVVGTVLFGQGIAGEGITYGYVLNTAALQGERGEALLSYITGHAELSEIGIFGGMALTALGAAVMMAALWFSRTVPRWLPVVPVAGFVLGLVIPLEMFSTERALFDLAVQEAPLVAVAVFALRHAQRAG